MVKKILLSLRLWHKSRVDRRKLARVQLQLTLKEKEFALYKEKSEKKFFLMTQRYEKSLWYERDLSRRTHKEFLDRMLQFMKLNPTFTEINDPPGPILEESIDLRTSVQKEKDLSWDEAQLLNDIRAEFFLDGRELDKSDTEIKMEWDSKYEEIIKDIKMQTQSSDNFLEVSDFS